MNVSRDSLLFTVGVEEHEGTRWRFEVESRTYIAEIKLGSGVTILDSPEDERGDIEAVADYLMAEDGIRFVYYGEKREQLRPRRREAPRPLRTDEADLLYHLLDVDVDDARLERLRQQVAHALVVDDSKLPFDLELHVPEGAALPAIEVDRNPSVAADSLRTDEHMVSVMLWLDGGYLSSIEVSWYEEEPDRLPLAGELGPAHWM